MTATLEDLAPVLISEPGVYPEIPEANYHADPVPEGSLSCSGAKKLLMCPALFKWEQDNPQPPKRHLEFGSAAHKLVLGVGQELVVVDAETWNTKDVKAEVAAIRAEGKVPLKPSEMAEVTAMAAALREHPLAGALLAAGSGIPEASLFWRDPVTGVMRRGRLDWLPHTRDGRLIIPDYKTCVSSQPRAFARAAATYRYHLQDFTYSEAVTTLGLAEDVAFVFIAQEKTPPYLVSVVQLDADARRMGRELNRRAVDTYLRCMTEDHWPGYSEDVELVSLPRWAEFQHDEEIA